MKASVIPAVGGTDVIEIQDLPTPTVEADEVLVEVKASAVNHTDVWIRRGHEGTPPVVTGIDVAGVITETGDAVTDRSVGDRVVLYWNTSFCGTCEHCLAGETTLCPEYGGLGVRRDGGHAEYVAIKSSFAEPIPEHISFTDAAAVPSSFGTAWRGLLTRANIQPEDDVLVLGASGGVGHGAVQIADHAGANVYACTSSTEKAQRLNSLGATDTIDYTETEITDAVYEKTDGRGVDVVFDSVGGDTYIAGMKSLVRGGKYVTIGATLGDADAAMLQHIFWKQLEVIGSTGCTQSEFQAMLSAFFDGHLSPEIFEVISLTEIPTAHEWLEEGKGFGRIIAEP